MFGGRKNQKHLNMAIIVTIFVLFFSINIPNAYAAGTLVMTRMDSKNTIGETTNIKVEIDTGGAKYNTLEFKLDYPTELVDFKINSVDTSGSVFPSQGKVSSTIYSCGVYNTQFSGKGDVVILPFKIKKAGDITIELKSIWAVDIEQTSTSGYQGDKNFSSNKINFTSVTGDAPAVIQETPSVTSNSGSAANNDISSSNGTVTGGRVVTPPATIITPVKAPTEVTPPSQTIGSIPQVIGPTGSTQ